MLEAAPGYILCFSGGQVEAAVEVCSRATTEAEELYEG
jgi:hypothetical protein